MAREPLSPPGSGQSEIEPPRGHALRPVEGAQPLLHHDPAGGEVSLRGDVVGGLTTFATMAYVVFVNPNILANEKTGMPFTGVLTATVLLSFSMTMLMGLYARIPFSVAPGMGINAFFAYSLVAGRGIPWPTALGIVTISGVLFVAVSLTPLRAQIALAIPLHLRWAAAGGIGLFLAFIGLRNCGLVVSDPATLVRVGKVGPEQLLGLAGLVAAAALLRRRHPFAFLVAIGAVSGAGWALGLVLPPAKLVSAPDFRSTLFALDLRGAARPELLPAAVSLFFTDLFDSIATFCGVSQAAGLVDKRGEPLRLREGLVVDAVATLSAGVFGTSSGTAFIESAAGIEVGARTGRAAVVTALCFLPCFFLAPLAQAIPPFATGPVLILVGALMFRSAVRQPLAAVEDLVPAFLTLVLIPLTFSITQGVLWGFLAHATLYTLTGRAREIPGAMWGIALLSLGLLLLEA